MSEIKTPISAEETEKIRDENHHIEKEKDALRRLRENLCVTEKKTFFDRIELITLTNEEKGSIAKDIVSEDGTGDKLYWMEIVLASAIATFGLLQNSVAIIIGAMLIAPLLSPMKAMAFAISTGRSRFFWKATLFLVQSIALSVGVAAVILFFSPIQAETSEILARTTPNILDLFVATFSAMVAFLSLAYKKLSSSVAGMAMAASLMPPLSVCGIELVLGHFSLAWGGFFLFLVNCLAILIVGVVIFMMYGFTPHEELKKKVTSIKVFTLLAIILLTTYPLYSSLSSISEKIKVYNQSYAFLEQEIPEKVQNGELSHLEVVSLNDEDVHLFGSVRVPENVEIYEETYSLLVEDLKEILHKDVDLRLEMVRTASFATKNTDVNPKNILHTLLRKKFPEMFPKLSLIQIESQKTKEGGENIWIVRLTVSLPSGEYLEDDDKQAFLDLIIKNFSEENLRFVWVPVLQAPEKKSILALELTPEQKFHKKIELEFQHFFATKFFQNIEVQNLEIVRNSLDSDVHLKKGEFSVESGKKEIVVSGTIVYPSSQRKKAIMNYIKNFVSTLSYDHMILKFRYMEYEEEVIEVNQKIGESEEKIEDLTSQKSVKSNE